MQIRGSDFVMYPVGDMARSLAFYRDTLGMVVESEYGGDDGTWVELTASPTTLALFQPADPNNGPPTGGAAIALAVENVDAAVGELKEKGVAVIWHSETPVCYVAVIRDPDGNGVILHQRKDGTCG